VANIATNGLEMVKEVFLLVTILKGQAPGNIFQTA
jgi:hypothetical protein